VERSVAAGHGPWLHAAAHRYQTSGPTSGRPSASAGWWCPTSSRSVRPTTTTRQCQWHAQPAAASVSWSQDDPASDLLTRPGLGQGGGVDEGSFPVWALARLAWARAVVGEVLVGGPLGRMPRQGL